MFVFLTFHENKNCPLISCICDKLTSYILLSGLSYVISTWFKFCNCCPSLRYINQNIHDFGPKDLFSKEVLKHLEY